MTNDPKAAQRELNKRYQDIKATIEMHQNAIEELNLQLIHLQRQCQHPNLYTYSAMGEKGKRCPDCGWSR